MCIFMNPSLALLCTPFNRKEKKRNGNAYRGIAVKYVNVSTRMIPSKPQAF